MCCTGITDKGLKNLVPMSNLENLDLRGCPCITDIGILCFSEMKNLKGLWLGGCSNVTPNGLRKLKELMPNCNVQKDEYEWSRHDPARQDAPCPGAEKKDR